MKKLRSCLLLGSDVHRAEIEEVRVRVVAVDFQDFGDEPPAGSSFNVNDDVEGIGDVCLNRTKAKVRPDTTMATSDRPRAIVLVNACWRTLTAFSHGELLVVCAKAGAASIKQKIMLRNRGASRENEMVLRRNRFMALGSRLKL